MSSISAIPDTANLAAQVHQVTARPDKPVDRAGAHDHNKSDLAIEPVKYAGSASVNKLDIKA